MPFFNGITRAMLQNAHAFASNGPTNTRAVSFGPTPVLTTASTADEDTHFYFGFIAKGDILHSFGFSSILSGSVSEFILAAHQIGTVDTEVALDDTFPSGTSVHATRYYNWQAPFDAVLVFSVDSYRRSRGATIRGINGTAVISRP